MDKNIFINGPSGVGKTTFINSLLGTNYKTDKLKSQT